MKKTQLEQIGEIPCACGRVAYVEQTNRKGGFIQLRCGACGVDQRTGKELQAKWLESLKPIGHYHNSVEVAPYNAATVEIVKDTIPDTKKDTIEPVLPVISEPEKKAAKPQVVRREAVKVQNNSVMLRTLFGFGVFVVSVGGAALVKEAMKLKV